MSSECLFFQLWLIVGFVSAIIAKVKGQSGYGWLTLKVVLGPLGFFLLASDQQAFQKTQRGQTKSEHKKCPLCAELVLAEAIKCKHCGADIKADKFYKRHLSTRTVLLLLIVSVIVIPMCMLDDIKKSNNSGNSDKDFFFKCLDAYPKDADICVSGQLKKQPFNTVQEWLKEYTAAHKPAKNSQ